MYGVRVAGAVKAAAFEGECAARTEQHPGRREVRYALKIRMSKESSLGMVFHMPAPNSSRRTFGRRFLALIGEITSPVKNKMRHRHSRLTASIANDHLKPAAFLANGRDPLERRHRQNRAHVSKPLDTPEKLNCQQLVVRLFIRVTNNSSTNLAAAA